MRTETELTLPTETLSTPLRFSKPNGAVAAKLEDVVVPERHALAAEIAKRLLDKHNARPDDLTIRQTMETIAREQGDHSDGQWGYQPPECTLRLIATLRMTQEAPRAAASNAKQIRAGNSFNVWKHATDRVFLNVQEFFPTEDPTQCEIPADIAAYFEDIPKLTRKAIKAEQAHRKTAEGRYEQARWNFDQFPLQALPAGAKEAIAELIDRAVDLAVERALAAHGDTEETK